MTMPESQSRKLGWGWALAGAVGALASLIGAAILYMVIYGYLVHPGEAEAYYEEYAKRSSPVVCVVAGSRSSCCSPGGSAGENPFAPWPRLS